MIIDVHSHHFPDALAPRALAHLCARANNTIQPIGDGTLANHLDHLDHDNIDHAILCQIATKPTQFDALLANACAIRDGKFGARAQKKIIPFLSVHPDDPHLTHHLEEIAKNGFRGLKFHPYYQNFDLTDPRVQPMFETIASLGLVVQCHCGFDVGYPGRFDACGPREIASLLTRVPTLKFIAAHLGGCAGHPPHATDRLRDLGCYVDTSALRANQYRDEEMRLLRSWPRERILFGTDFPWTMYSESVRWVKKIREASDWSALFGDNARRLLNI